MDSDTTPQEPGAMSIRVEPWIVQKLDRYRRNTPIVNRTSLVNQILLSWIHENIPADEVRRLSQ